MVNMVVSFLMVLLTFVLMVVPAEAKFDPFSTANNKFGISILDINNLNDAADLVNSTGGQWGYVTIVMQEDDRNFDKWQGVLDKMRRLHLIPIVRIATKIQGDRWTKPSADGVDDWVRFLDSLNWPIENRYVVLYNEPNHAKEWGGTINPEEYASLLEVFAQKLHEKSEDFFVLPAALDVSAASDGASLDANEYLARMIRAAPSFFDRIDGWNSHSYPNPGFSGSVYASGRGTLKSYQWELDRLNALGLTRNLPVFITETGWVHSEGMAYFTAMPKAAVVASNMSLAARDVWSDNRIAAVTPFVLSYQGAPFDHFSWKQFGQDSYYPQFGQYQSVPKIHGEPWQRESYELVHPLMPKSLVAGSSYALQTEIVNKGQGILSANHGYALHFGSPRKFSVVFDPVPELEPGQKGTISMHVQTPLTLGSHTFALDIEHSGRQERIQSGIIKLVPPPSANVHIQLGWRSQNTTHDITVLIYDHLTLVHKISGFSSKNGLISITGLRNIVPDHTYRVVVLVPYYLPRQVIAPLGKDNTRVTLPRFYPLDLDKDGAFSWKDVFAMYKMKPNQIFALWVGL